MNHKSQLILPFFFFLAAIERNSRGVFAPSCRLLQLLHVLSDRFPSALIPERAGGPAAADKAARRNNHDREVINGALYSCVVFVCVCVCVADCISSHLTAAGTNKRAALVSQHKELCGGANPPQSLANHSKSVGGHAPFHYLSI